MCHLREGLLVRIEERHAMVGPHPDILHVILIDTSHIIARQTVRHVLLVGVVLGFATVDIDHRQTFAG